VVKDIILKVIEDNKELETSLDDLIIKMIESSTKSYTFWSGSEKFETQFSLNNIVWLGISPTRTIRYFYIKAMIDFIDDYKLSSIYPIISKNRNLPSLKGNISYYCNNCKNNIDKWLKI
jgi:hypothetical protein